MEENKNGFLKILKNKLIMQSIISSVLFIIGVLFCVIPVGALSVVKTITTIVALVVGSIATLIYCLAPASYHDPKHLVIGVVGIVVGVLLVYVPSLFVIALSVIMIIGGVQNVCSGAIGFKRTKNKSKIYEIVFGSIIFALGLTALILANTKLAQNIVMIVFGVLLIAKALFDLVLICWLKNETLSIKEMIKPQNTTVQTEEIFDNKEESNNSEQ